MWSGGNTSKLLKLQQKFCRQHQVQLPNLSNRFKFHTLTLFYKIRNGLAPTYLSEILPETLALSSGRNLRRHVYPFPRINKSSTMQSFLPRATVFWNELPASIQSSSSLHSFKAKLRDLLIKDLKVSYIVSVSPHKAILSILLSFLGDFPYQLVS